MNGEQQSTAPYRLNINHPEIREAYEAFKPKPADWARTMPARG